MGKKIVTEIEQFQKWWDAEDYHQMCQSLMLLSYCPKKILFTHTTPCTNWVCLLRLVTDENGLRNHRFTSQPRRLWGMLWVWSRPCYPICSSDEQCSSQLWCDSLIWGSSVRLIACIGKIGSRLRLHGHTRGPSACILKHILTVLYNALRKPKEIDRPGL